MEAVRVGEEARRLDDESNTVDEDTIWVGDEVATLSRKRKRKLNKAEANFIFAMRSQRRRQ